MLFLFIEQEPAKYSSANSLGGSVFPTPLRIRMSDISVNSVEPASIDT